MGVLEAAILATVLSASQAPKVSVSLTPEARSVVPGQPFTVAIRIDLERPWHVYWRNPGDSGVPTIVEWRLPKGWKAGPLQFPVPKRFGSEGGTAYGHDGEIVLLAQITPDAKATGTAKVGANVLFLACLEACVPGEAPLEASVRLGPSPLVDQTAKPLFDRARKALPSTARGLSTAALAESDAYAMRVGGLSDMKEAYFYSDEPNVISNAASQPLEAIDGGFTLRLARSEYAKKPAARLTGVLAVTDAAGKTRGYQLDLAIARRP
ncbi:MAG TPA: protein-disulfide reductase DsbD family protein [Fimbriimonadaceae bacterium]|nr:protein-disulfide reductase DsbD family protein [Fimbriimonadaceae bacterium]HRJ97105.1 protein-disulfide reductase DsbD family protein [Fimbriimonadaceae bacterium]